MGRGKVLQHHFVCNSAIRACGRVRSRSWGRGAGAGGASAEDACGWPCSSSPSFRSRVR
jgi:hypothetical protein